MAGSGQSENFFRRIGDKRLLTGDANALATIVCVHLGDMRLQSGSVAIGACALRPGFGGLLGVGDLFHNYLRLHVYYVDLLSMEMLVIAALVYGTQDRNGNQRALL
jgi:hypothetical protein